MLELNDDTIANAAERARREHPRVSLITPRQEAELEGARGMLCGPKYLVSCKNPEHPGGHITRFRRHPADGSLWGECVLAATGERCPAARAGHVCYHIAAGVVLFLELDARRRAGRAKRAPVVLPTFVTPGRVRGPREAEPVAA